MLPCLTAHCPAGEEDGDEEGDEEDEESTEGFSPSEVGSGGSLGEGAGPGAGATSSSHTSSDDASDDDDAMPMGAGGSSSEVRLKRPGRLPDPACSSGVGWGGSAASRRWSWGEWGMTDDGHDLLTPRSIVLQMDDEAEFDVARHFPDIVDVSPPPVAERMLLTLLAQHIGLQVRWVSFPLLSAGPLCAPISLACAGQSCQQGRLGRNGHGNGGQCKKPTCLQVTFSLCAPCSMPIHGCYTGACTHDVAQGTLPDHKEHPCTHARTHTHTCAR